jgi:hypothetical protein
MAHTRCCALAADALKTSARVRELLAAAAVVEADDLTMRRKGARSRLAPEVCSLKRECLSRWFLLRLAKSQ